MCATLPIVRRSVRVRTPPPTALLVVLLALPVAGCGDAVPDEETTRAPADPGAAAQIPELEGESMAPGRAGKPGAEASARLTEGPLVVFLGDSLTAGYGLSEDQAYPALVEEILEAEGVAIRTVNAGVSGDTTAGGARRVDWLLRQGPDILVVALGGNDALRGLDPGQTAANLRRIVETAQGAGVEVLLAGMLAPPNLGPAYTGAFADIYPRLAAELEVARMPFLLDGVAGDPALNQADGIHPTAEGQAIIARRMADLLRPLADGA